MKSVELTVRVSPSELLKAATRELTRQDAEAPFQLAELMASQRRSAALSSALDHVIRATNRYDRDQYSIGEGSAATALFEACKRLRKVLKDEKISKGKRP